MNNQHQFARGVSTVSMLVGMALLTAASTGALHLMGTGLQSRNNLKTEELVNKVNRIGEIMTVHLNRGGSSINADVRAKGIQLCSLSDSPPRCNGYNANRPDFCISIPSRVSLGGQDVIKVTGFRLHNKVLAQRDMDNVNMAQFEHREFCENNQAWRDLHSPEDFELNEIQFCRFDASTTNQVTGNYENNCPTVIQGAPRSNMFWIALFKARMQSHQNERFYKEARIIHLLNHTRVGVGT